MAEIIFLVIIYYFYVQLEYKLSKDNKLYNQKLHFDLKRIKNG